MKTIVLNEVECGYKQFMTIGPITYGFGGSKGNQRLHIMRTVIIQDNTKKVGSSMLGKPELAWDVYMDIYLTEGTIIRVETDETPFIRKMMKYNWELHPEKGRANPFEGLVKPQLTELEKQKLEIMKKQLETEKNILHHLETERNIEAMHNDWESYKVQVKQKKVLAAQRRICNLKQQIEKLESKAR